MDVLNGDIFTHAYLSNSRNFNSFDGSGYVHAFNNSIFATLFSNIIKNF